MIMINMGQQSPTHLSQLQVEETSATTYTFKAEVKLYVQCINS